MAFIEGYLLKGPLLLDTDNNAEAIKSASEIAYKLKDVWQLISLFEIGIIENMKEFMHRRATDIYRAAVIITETLQTRSLEHVLDRFINLWNAAKDKEIISKIDPDDPTQKILFVGGTTIDVPHGIVYNIFFLADIFNWFTLYNIH